MTEIEWWKNEKFEKMDDFCTGCWNFDMDVLLKKLKNKEMEKFINKNISEIKNSKTNKKITNLKKLKKF